MSYKVKQLISRTLPFVIATAAFIYVEMMINKVGGMKLSFQLKQQIVPLCCWVIMALSLNLVVGISGELSLGHAGFMSIGCFTGTVANAWLLNAGVVDLFPRLALTFIAAGAMACIFGVLIGIPVMRLRGDYLAIVTLAFGQIIMNLLNCVYVSIDKTTLYFSFAKALKTGTGIVNGSAASKLITRTDVIDGVKVITKTQLAPDKGGFVVGFILVIITLFVVLNLVHSRSGRAIMAVRDNRIAAESTGINVTKYRLMAFVVSATLAGVAGALFGMNSTAAPSKFGINESIDVLVFVVLGGIGNMSGSIIAAVLLKILPEQLRFLNDYRMLVYAIVLIFVMLITNNKKIRDILSSITALIKRPLKRGKRKEAE